MKYIDVQWWHNEECPSCRYDGIVHHNYDDRWCIMCWHQFRGRPCCREHPLAKAWQEPVLLASLDAVHALDSISGEDPEVDHGRADNILLRSVSPEVREAYERLVDRARWWAGA